jgi:heparan-alpha-glucosaminide N-acetyltransferase
MATVEVLDRVQPRAGIAEVKGAALPSRLASLDVYRGFVMFLMMAEVLRLCRVSEALSGSGFWRFLCYHQSHVAWIGCSLHDLIQPSFSFIVGVALPFSLAARLARGHSRLKLSVHAFYRALVLIGLGVFLRSIGRPQTNFTFEDTLSQIGFGYGLLFLLSLRPLRDQFITLGLILAGYWAAFALYPLPAPDFDYTKVGVPSGWPHLMSGFAGHWNKNSNLAWAFDTWFLNLFPRPKPFEFNGGGYATLSFIPTLGTMILGLIAGEILRSSRASWAKVRWLAIAGGIGLLSGLLLGWLGICPVVKRIWTPSWTLFSGGWCFLILAGLYVANDIKGWKSWAFPLVVIGMNSIAIYCMTWLFEDFFLTTLKVHLGQDAFRILGAAYEPLLQGAAVLILFWLLLYWMYRRRLFLRI